LPIAPEARIMADRTLHGDDEPAHLHGYGSIPAALARALVIGNVDNGQGLCEACDLTKQAPGWRSRARPDGTIQTTTPTGHTSASSPPHLPTSPPWHLISIVDERLARRLLEVA
jgi:hypothetical protein